MVSYRTELDFLRLFVKSGSKASQSSNWIKILDSITKNMSVYSWPKIHLLITYGSESNAFQKQDVDRDLFVNRRYSESDCAYSDKR
jgi:hypothetical protein